MPAAKKKGLQVTAPLIQVSLGSAVVQFAYGDILPDGVSEDSLEHLKSLGYVGEVDAPESDNK